MITDAISIITIPATLLSKKQIMEKAFCELQRIGHLRLKVVVEVDKKITSTKLADLLVTLKSGGRGGDNNCLIQSIVVLSSSKASPGITNSILFRAKVHSIGDLTDSESKMFMKQLFKDCDPTLKCYQDEEFNKEVDEAHSLIGNRLSYLHEVKKSLKKVNNLKETMEQIVKVEARNKATHL